MLLLDIVVAAGGDGVMRDACTAAALQELSCGNSREHYRLYDESFASHSKLIDKTSAFTVARCDYWLRSELPYGPPGEARVDLRL